MKSLGAILTGLIAWVVLTFFAVTLKRNAVEADVQRGVVQEMRASGYDVTGVTIEGRDVIASGSFSESDRQNIEDHALQVDGVRDVDLGKPRIVAVPAPVNVVKQPKPAPVAAPVKKAAAWNSSLLMSKSAKGIELTGHMRTDELNLFKTNWEKAGLPKANFSKIITYDGVANVPWHPLLNVAALQSKNLVTGTVAADAKGVHVTGVVADADMKSRVDGAVAKLGKPFVGTSKIAVAAKLTKNACQTALNRLLTEGNIEFKSGSAAVKSSSYPLLKKVADVEKRCPNLKFSVEGHTDNVGKKASNLALSQRRSTSVKKLLTKFGVKAKLIEAKGYGSTKPVADNATATGRQKNRRIEILTLDDAA